MISRLLPVYYYRNSPNVWVRWFLAQRLLLQSKTDTAMAHFIEIKEECGEERREAWMQFIDAEEAYFDFLRLAVGRTDP